MIELRKQGLTILNGKKFEVQFETFAFPFFFFLSCLFFFHWRMFMHLY